MYCESKQLAVQTPLHLKYELIIPLPSNISIFSQNLLQEVSTRQRRLFFNELSSLTMWNYYERPCIQYSTCQKITAKGHPRHPQKNLPMWEEIRRIALLCLEIFFGKISERLCYSFFMPREVRGNMNSQQLQSQSPTADKIQPSHRGLGFASKPRLNFRSGDTGKWLPLFLLKTSTFSTS